jgi:hypothetical protein
MFPNKYLLGIAHGEIGPCRCGNGIEGLAARRDWGIDFFLKKTGYIIEIEV